MHTATTSELEIRNGVDGNLVQMHVLIRPLPLLLHHSREIVDVTQETSGRVHFLEKR